MNIKTLLKGLDSNKLIDLIIKEIKKGQVMGSEANITEDMKENIKKKINDFLLYIESIEAIENKHQIIYCVQQEADKEITYETGMIYKEDISINTPENNMGCSFMCTPWKEIIGTEICKTSIDKYGEYEVAVQIIKEMTYFGFTEKEYKENRNAFDNMLSNITKTMENMKDAEDVFEEMFPDKEVSWNDEYIILEIETNSKLKEEFWNIVKEKMKGPDV